MIVVTTPDLPGRQVAEVLGQVFGVVVRSRGLGGNLVASLRTLVGGEIHEYTQMLEEARRHAIDRMVENASVMGADAILAMRFDSSEIGETMTEVVAYGTAVRTRPAPAASAGAHAEAPATGTTATGTTATGAAPVGGGGFGHRSHVP